MAHTRVSISIVYFFLLIDEQILGTAHVQYVFDDEAAFFMTLNKSVILVLVRHDFMKFSALSHG